MFNVLNRPLFCCVSAASGTRWLVFWVPVPIGRTRRPGVLPRKARIAENRLQDTSVFRVLTLRTAL